MIAYELIAKKRDGESLKRGEISFLIDEFVGGGLPDYQMAAFLMAAYIRGLSDKETFYLTEAMASSGIKVDLSAIGGPKVDKHSTGGVGDKTTLVVCPIVSSLGVMTPKFSGRSLGHTGGTIDKLESIPGFTTTLSLDDFISLLKRSGIAIAQASGEINPADKKLYALRDVTATVSSIPLIASSVMSKKIASGAKRIVLDVKAGGGAFIAETQEAKELARLMLDIARQAGIKATAVISRMDQPLGRSCGNSLEVIEAIETLKGKGPKDLLELSKVIAAKMVEMGLEIEFEEAKRMVEGSFESLSGVEKFKEMVVGQGGDESIIDDYSHFPRAEKVIDLVSKSTGYLFDIDAKKVGLGLIEIGAGRKIKGIKIDYGAGLVLEKKVGSKVKNGETLAKIHFNPPTGEGEAIANFEGAFKIQPERPIAKDLIIDILE